MPKDNQIPEKYLCSITGQVMIDPVFTSDGHTYEREKIEEWLQTHDISPKTGANLENKKLTANHDKRSDISDFLENHPELYDGDEVYLPKDWLEKCVIAIKQNQLQVVQQWLNKDRRLLTLKLEGNYTALHLACEFSSPELVEMLLNILKQKNKFIFTIDGIQLNPKHLNSLLETSLKNSDYDKCELLLKLGAEVEQPEASTKNTLLHRMVTENSQKAIDWLLEHKAVLESRNSEGNTPLLLSVMGANKKIIDFLLLMNANLDVKNAQQKTPLYISVEKGDIEIVRLLLAHGANPIINCEPEKFSILHMAANRGDLAILKLLLLTKALDLIDAQNANGETALHSVVRAGHGSLISALLEAGAYHKIKNEQDQTPVELARAQQKPTTANRIVQTVRELKKAKLKEIDKLHQVTAGQASEIANLEIALNCGSKKNVELKNMLENQSQSFKAQLFDMEAKLEKLLSPVVPQMPTPSSSVLIFAPPGSPRSVSPIMHIHTPVAVSNVNQKESEEFLRLVAEGKQDKAEDMLKSNLALALVAGDVTDLSKRTFTGITGFQYAVWALDWHMWTMIRKYLPDEDARLQAQGFETGSWVKTYGINAKGLLDNLNKAYETTIDLYGEFKWTKGNRALVKEVGGAQLLLPAHIVNEYCYRNNPFYNNPQFNVVLSLPRSCTIDYANGWFTTKPYATHELGFDAAFCRSGSNYEYLALREGVRQNAKGRLVSNDPSDRELVEGVQNNRKVVRELTNVRTAQREELIAELTAKKVQRKVV